MQNYNFGCCFVWVCNLFAHIEGETLVVFENRTLRRIFRPKKDEVTRQWRKRNDDELNYQ